MGKKVVYKVKTDEPTLFVAAINSAEEDYRLAWLLNGLLKLQLVRVEHITPLSNQNFSVFYYQDDVGRMSYTLVANKMHGSYLVPQLKNIDYLFKISGTLADRLQTETISKIRSLDEITACIRIESGSAVLFNLLRDL